MTWLSRLEQAAAKTSRRLLSRSYAAAALQYDYNSEDEGQRRMEARAESAEVWAPGRGIQWVVMGDKSKRHVYAEKLSKLLEVPFISMTSLLRQELHPRSSFYQQIANAVNEGKLVPEDVIFGLLSKRLDEGFEKGESGFILDGIPRTRIQAVILDQIADIDLVVNFKCAEENLVRRGSIGMGCFESSYANAADVLKEKFRVRAEQGKELEEYYGKQQKLVDFQVAASAPGEIWQGLLAALHLKHMSALSSSQKLAT